MRMKLVMMIALAGGTAYACPHQDAAAQKTAQSTEKKAEPAKKVEAPKKTEQAKAKEPAAKKPG